MSSVDWQAFVFDCRQGWTERLMKVARRRFPDPTLAEAAYNSAFEKLSSDDWSALKSFNGRAKPGTFLVAVFSRLLEDYSRSRFGRPRPPTWLSRLGETWKRIFKMLCLERVPTEAIVDRFMAEGDRAEREIRRAITVIKGKIPNCGEVRGETPMANPPEPSNPSGGNGDPLRELMEEDLKDMLDALTRMLEVDPAPKADQGLEGRRGSLRPRLISAMRIEPEERLILKNVFQDARSVAATARLLDLPEHQVRRRLNGILKRLRKAFRDEGMDL